MERGFTVRRRIFPCQQPARFTPLHAVAEALIEWLHGNFEVTIEQDMAVAQDLLHLRDDVIRAVRVVPRNPAAAMLTFVLTRFPGVYLHAGSLHDFHFPECGCDACDDEVTNLAADLEWTVRTVASRAMWSDSILGRGVGSSSSLMRRGSGNDLAAAGRRNSRMNV